MLPPLPPFRSKPSLRPRAPKRPAESRKDAADISVKARRLPVRFARLRPAPSLKVLSRTLQQA